MGGHAPPLACSRLLDFPDEASRCGMPVTDHVMWDDDGRNGLVCFRHAEEARSKWDYLGIHPYRMQCSMPGAVYLHDHNICVVDEGLLGIEEPELETALIDGDAHDR